MEFENIMLYIPGFDFDVVACVVGGSSVKQTHL